MAYAKSADSNRVSLRYVKEVTPGVTPNAALQEVRMTGESFSGSRTSISSNEIRADRNISDLVTTAENASGSLEFELSPGSYDDFLAAAVGGVWDNDVLVNGINEDYFTFEKFFQDINKRERYFGCAVSTFNLSCQTGSMVTGSFEFMGFGQEDVTAPVGNGTVNPPTTTPIYNLTTDMTSFKVNGVEYADGLTNFSLNVNANLRSKPVIGSKYSTIGFGSLAITGDWQSYFTNANPVLDIYKNETAVAVEFTFSKGGKSYKVELPKVKFGSKEHVAGGINQDVELNMTYQAILDGTVGGMIRITRATV